MIGSLASVTVSRNPDFNVGGQGFKSREVKLNLASWGWTVVPQQRRNNQRKNPLTLKNIKNRIVNNMYRLTHSYFTFDYSITSDPGCSGHR